VNRRTRVALISLGLVAAAGLTTLSLCAVEGDSEAPAPPPKEEAAGAEGLRKGKSLMPTRVYSAEQDAQVLARFDGLRVADVTDGMDKAGLS
jgi:hypothetical protein